jgi:hypothetical protein
MGRPIEVHVCKERSRFMSKTAHHASGPDAKASAADIKRVFGDLDTAIVLDILALNPTLRDIEDAALWLGGDPDIFGAGKPLKGVAGEIVAILTADEEDEGRPGPRAAS